MTTKAAVSSLEESIAPPEETGGSGAVARPRASPETDADKVRRQLLLRRKIKIARRALLAHRSR